MHLLKQILVVTIAVCTLVVPGRSASPEADVKKVVETFYQGYYREILLNPKKSTDDGAMIKWLKASPYTTPAFPKAVEKAIARARKQDPELGLDSDPVVAGQDYPKKGYRAKTVKIVNNQANITVEGIGESQFHIALQLVQVNGHWLIDRIADIPPAATGRR